MSSSYFARKSLLLLFFFWQSGFPPILLRKQNSSYNLPMNFFKIFLCLNVPMLDAYYSQMESKVKRTPY